MSNNGSQQSHSTIRIGYAQAKSFYPRENN